jgi:hypothetical protein
MNASSWLYRRTYYDLFQVAITKKHLRDGFECIRKGHEAALAFTSDEDNESVRKMRSFVDILRVIGITSYFRNGIDG